MQQRTDIYRQLQDLIELRKKQVELIASEGNKQLKRSVGIDAKPTSVLDAEKPISKLGIEAKLTSKVKEMNASYQDLEEAERAKVDKLLRDNHLDELLGLLKEKKSGSSFARKLGTININEKEFIDQLNELMGIDPEESNSDEFAAMDTGTVRQREDATVRNDEVSMAVARASNHTDNIGYIANRMFTPWERGEPGDALSIIVEAFEVLKKSKTNKKKEARSSLDGSISGNFRNKYLDSLTEQVRLLTTYYGAFNDIAKAQPIIARRLASIREILIKPAADQMQLIAKAEAVIAIIDDLLLEKLKELQHTRSSVLKKSQ